MLGSRWLSWIRLGHSSSSYVLICELKTQLFIHFYCFRCIILKLIPSRFQIDICGPFQSPEVSLVLVTCYHPKHENFKSYPTWLRPTLVTLVFKHTQILDPKSWWFINFLREMNDLPAIVKTKHNQITHHTQVDINNSQVSTAPTISDKQQPFQLKIHSVYSNKFSQYLSNVLRVIFFYHNSFPEDLYSYHRTGVMWY